MYEFVTHRIQWKRIHCNRSFICIEVFARYTNVTRTDYEYIDGRSSIFRGYYYPNIVLDILDKNATDIEKFYLFICKLKGIISGLNYNFKN